jgi:hypothetical protein
MDFEIGQTKASEAFLAIGNDQSDNSFEYSRAPPDDRR